MFPRSPVRSLLSALGLALGAVLFWSCQNATQAPPDTVLRLKLNDSLSRYDSVVITILDRQDMSKILEKVWSGRLNTPSLLPGHTLSAAKDKDFIVRVAGYAADGQLFVETLIYYEGGKATVYHNPVPPYKPRNLLQSLSLSSGKLSPGFLPDSLSYQAVIAEGIKSVIVNLQAQFSGAIVTLAGDTVAAGAASKPVAMGTTPDTLAIIVTDASQGAAYARAYRLILNPTLPPKVLLASITPSVGVLSPPFSLDNRVYSLRLPADKGSVTFVLHPTDPQTMTMLFMGVGIFDGEVSRPIAVSPGGSDVADMEVYRGSEHTYYQITIDRP
jgi:hypothetical protein